MRLDRARDAWRLDRPGASPSGLLAAPATVRPRGPLPLTLEAWGDTVTPKGRKPKASAGLSARQRSLAVPWRRARARPASRAARGGAGCQPPAAGRIASGHHALQRHCRPIRWTIMGGQDGMDIDGQGEGWTKCSGWPHRRVRRLTGFSTTWAGSGRRIGRGRAAGVRGGT